VEAAAAVGTVLEEEAAVGIVLVAEA